MATLQGPTCKPGLRKSSTGRWAFDVCSQRLMGSATHVCIYAVIGGAVAHSAIDSSTWLLHCKCISTMQYTTLFLVLAYDELVGNERPKFVILFAGASLHLFVQSMARPASKAIRRTSRSCLAPALRQSTQLLSIHCRSACQQSNRTQCCPRCNHT